ncbi:hypothetical protein FRC04_008989 [Tulasnella sp. 424]|nr:hypothetical protein FRC04_008989 [Tulasnella sp. 424]KAG8973647.1 hypothetical protein FRC05_008583 [Tulasnella sp. 425]
MSSSSRRSSYAQATSHSSSQTRKVSATPSNSSQADHARQGSDPAVITVIRNGKVYHSKKTPAGELNSRGRRKMRRAEEREAAAQEAARQQGKAGPDDGWIGESPKVDVYDESAVAATLGSSYDLSNWKFPTSSPSSPSYRSKAPPPLNPFVREGSPSAGPAQRNLLAPPFTPSPSGSDDGRASSPHSSHSRSSSLNANAAVFSPTRYCPLTPRSPCSSNGGHSRAASIAGSPGAQASEGNPLYSRRHSLALAAWEAAQRRMSTQRLDTKPDDQAIWSPTAPLSAQSWAPGTSYGDGQGWTNFASPTHSRTSSENLGRVRSGSLAAGATYNGSSAGPAGRKASASSLEAQSAVFSPFTASDYYAARRGSLPPAIANVHAQYGMDPAVDQLADLGHLIHAPGPHQTSLASPPILEDLSSRDIRRMESAIVQPRPVRRSARLTEGWVAEQNGRSKRRSPLTSNSELDD